MTGRPRPPRRVPVSWRGLSALYSAREREIMTELREGGAPAEELFLLHEAKACLDATIVERA